MSSNKVHVFEDGSSIEWIDRETLRYRKGDFSVSIWVDFAPGFFVKGRILAQSSITNWATKPDGAPSLIDGEQRNEIIEKIQEYYRAHRVKLTLRD
jgi:hypothetical protein